MEIGSVIELESHQYYNDCSSNIPFYLPFMGKKEWSTIFYQSGRNAIEQLVYELYKEKDEKILLPDYICGSVTQAVERAGVQYENYSLDINLEFCEEEIDNLLKDNVRCIYIAHYFGKKIDSKKLESIRRWKAKGILIIEDITLSLFSKDDTGIGFGDYVLGSIRKWLPIPDGGFIATVGKKLPSDGKMKSISQYTFYYLLVQMMKREYVAEGCVNKELKSVYMTYYRKAMENLFSDYTIRPMSDFSKNYLKNYDINQIIKRRIQNYDFLDKRLREDDRIRPIVIRSKNYVPLGMTVLCEKRDDFLQYMIKHNIYCNVHWILPGRKENHVIKQLSSSIMTIPCDQRYEIRDMEYIVDIMDEWRKCDVSNSNQKDI